MSREERLALMANQIARNFALLGHDGAAAATADHIASYWDPRMKTVAFAMLESGTRPAFLTDVAADAIRGLRDYGPPPPQSGATEFNDYDEGGHSDAG